ncbi:unnamed protein product, partial [marine sediment metagenome]
THTNNQANSHVVTLQQAVDAGATATNDITLSGTITLASRNDQNLVAGFNASGAGKTDCVVLGTGSGVGASGDGNTHVGTFVGAIAVGNGTAYYGHYSGYQARGTNQMYMAVYPSNPLYSAGGATNDCYFQDDDGKLYLGFGATAGAGMADAGGVLRGVWTAIDTILGTITNATALNGNTNTPSYTDTTYTGGTNIDLVGTEFNLDAAAQASDDLADSATQPSDDWTNTVSGTAAATIESGAALGTTAVQRDGDTVTGGIDFDDGDGASPWLTFINQNDKRAEFYLNASDDIIIEASWGDVYLVPAEGALDVWVGGGQGDIDYQLKFYGDDYQGVMRWMEAEDRFEFDDGVWFLDGLDMQGTAIANAVFYGNGGSITNLDGSLIQAGTIDETALDVSVNASLDLADSAMQDLVDDTTPTLGGGLDAAGYAITAIDYTSMDTNAAAVASVAGKLVTSTTDSHIYAARAGVTNRYMMGDANGYFVSPISWNFLTVEPSAVGQGTWARALAATHSYGVF